MKPAAVPPGAQTTQSSQPQPPPVQKLAPKPIAKKEPSQEEDLIKVVLTAVEGNWLKQVNQSINSKFHH